MYKRLHKSVVTISDIAAALGVTPSTVSRALSGHPRVREETRQAVLQKAGEMGYERNVMASNLRRGRSDIVGIVIPRIYREFFSNVIGGAESILRQAGYNVLISQTMEKKDAELHALRTLRKYQVACIMMSHSIESDDPQAVSEAIGDTPLVQFDRVFSSLPGAKVVNDNFESAYAATRHLASKGYKRIGHLAGHFTCEAFVERFKGYRTALEDCGLEYDESIVFHETIVRESGHLAARKAVAAGCDALYSAGDFSALGAIEGLREMGLCIPRDFGMVGTADEAFTGIMTPSLSSLDQHPYEIGQAAAKAFLFGSKAWSLISMELKIRESSNRKEICLK